MVCSRSVGNSHFYVVSVGNFAVLEFGRIPSGFQHTQQSKSIYLERLGELYHGVYQRLGQSIRIVSGDFRLCVRHHSDGAYRLVCARVVFESKDKRNLRVPRVVLFAMYRSVDCRDVDVGCGY